MITRLQIVIGYILCALRLFIGPWRFFQISAEHFDEKKKTFSKMQLCSYVPQKWHLTQHLLEETNTCGFPLFVKPEWSQNANGIEKIESPQVLEQFKAQLTTKNTYFCQQAAPATKEFEILIIQSIEPLSSHYFFNITEVLNKAEDRLPINGVCNQNTYYRDRTDILSLKDQQKIRHLLNTIKSFRMARFCISSNSIKNLLAEQFFVIEINVFLPMPVSLLDTTLSPEKYKQYLHQITYWMAKAVQSIPRSQPKKAIFFPQLFKHYQMKYENYRSNR